MNRDITLADYPFPSSAEIEFQVIGDFIGTPETRNETIKIVTPAMFANADCRNLWLLLQDKHTHNEVIDMVSVFPLCDKSFFMDNIAMRCDYSGIKESQAHALALQETYIKREIYKSGIAMVQGAVNGSSSEELLSIPKRMEDRITSNTSSSDMISLYDSINEVMDDMEKGVALRIRTGIATIDELCHGGFGAGQLIVIGARPSAGKTSLSLDIAQRSARDGHPACYFTIEMTHKDLAIKTMLATGEISMYDVVCERKDWERLERAVSKAQTPNLYISKKCTTITQIMNKITTMHQDGRCHIAFVDYLQLIRGYGKDLRERMTNITGALKQLAIELGIPIVLMSQLNRDSSREGRRPYSSDLKESGATEQDADIIILLERPRDGEIQNRIDMYLDKNRGGSICTDTIRLQGTNAFANFLELTDNTYDNEPY